MRWLVNFGLGTLLNVCLLSAAYLAIELFHHGLHTPHSEAHEKESVKPAGGSAPGSRDTH